MRQKLIVRPEELILPTFDIKTKNLPRENFDKQLDAIAAKGCITFQPTLLFYQIEPLKNEASLILCSSIAKNSSAPNAKRIFEIL